LKKASIENIRKINTKVIIIIDGEKSYQTMRNQLKGESKYEYLK